MSEGKCEFDWRASLLQSNALARVAWWAGRLGKESLQRREILGMLPLP